MYTLYRCPSDCSDKCVYCLSFHSGYPSNSVKLQQILVFLYIQDLSAITIWLKDIISYAFIYSIIATILIWSHSEVRPRRICGNSFQYITSPCSGYSMFMCYLMPVGMRWEIIGIQRNYSILDILRPPKSSRYVWDVLKYKRYPQF